MLGFHSISETAISSQVEGLAPIVGNIVFSTSITGTLKEKDKLTASVSFSETVTGTFDLTRNFPNESITNTFSISSTFKVKNKLNGSVSASATVDGGQKERDKFVPSSTYSASIAGTFDLTRNFPNEQVTFSVQIAASLQRVIQRTGNVTFTLTPDSQQGVARIFSANTSFSTTISSGLEIVIPSNLELEWHINTQQDVASLLFTVYYPGVQASAFFYSSINGTFEYGLQGDVTATLITFSKFSKALDGSVILYSTPSGIFDKNQKLNGAVTSSVVISSTFKKKQKITGQATFTVTPASEFSYRRIFATSVALTPAASFEYELQGNVTYTLLPSAKFIIKRNFTAAFSLIPSATSSVLTLLDANFGFNVASKFGRGLRGNVTNEALIDALEEVTVSSLVNLQWHIDTEDDVATLPFDVITKGIDGSIDFVLTPDSIFNRVQIFDGSIIFADTIPGKIGYEFRGSTSYTVSVNSVYEVVNTIDGSILFNFVPSSKFSYKNKLTANNNALPTSRFARSFDASVTFAVSINSIPKFFDGSVPFTALPSGQFSGDKLLEGDVDFIATPSSTFKKIYVSYITFAVAINGKRTRTLQGNVSFTLAAITGFGLQSLASTTFSTSISSEFSYRLQSYITYTANVDGGQQRQRLFSGNVFTQDYPAGKLSLVLKSDLTFNLSFSAIREFDILGNITFGYSVDSTQLQQRDIQGNVTYFAVPAITGKNIIVNVLDTTVTSLPNGNFKTSAEFNGSVTCSSQPASKFNTAKKFNSFVTCISSVSTIFDYVGRSSLSANLSLTPDFTTEYVQYFNGTNILSLSAQGSTSEVDRITGNVNFGNVVVAGFGLRSGSQVTFSTSISSIFSYRLFSQIYDSVLFEGNAYRLIPYNVFFNTTISSSITSNQYFSGKLTANLLPNTTTKSINTLNGSISNTLLTNTTFKVEDESYIYVTFTDIVSARFAKGDTLDSTLTLLPTSIIDYSQNFDSFYTFNLQSNFKSKQIYLFTGYADLSAISIAGFGLASKTDLTFKVTVNSLREFGLLGNVVPALSIESSPLVQRNFTGQVETSVQVNSKMNLQKQLVGNIPVNSSVDSDIELLSIFTAEVNEGILPAADFKLSNKLSGNIFLSVEASSDFAYSILSETDFSAVPESIFKQIDYLYGQVPFATDIEISAGIGAFGTATFNLSPAAAFYKRLLEDNTKFVVINAPNKAVYIEMKQIIKNNSNVQTIKNNLTPVKLSGVNSSSRIVFAPTKIQIITKGVPGPTGPAGGEESVPFAKRVDFESSDTVIYQGWATPGATDAQASWRISKTTFINDQGDTIVQWADGDAEFNNVWNNRLILSYS